MGALSERVVTTAGSLLFGACIAFFIYARKAVRNSIEKQRILYFIEGELRKNRGSITEGELRALAVDIYEKNDFLYIQDLVNNRLIE